MLVFYGISQNADGQTLSMTMTTLSVGVLIFMKCELTGLALSFALFPFQMCLCVCRGQSEQCPWHQRRSAEAERFSAAAPAPHRLAGQCPLHLVKSSVIL